MLDQGFDDEWPKFETSRASEAVEGHGWIAESGGNTSAALRDVQWLLSKVLVHWHQVTEDWSRGMCQEISKDLHCFTVPA